MKMRPAGGIVIHETFIRVSSGFTLKAEDYIDKPVRPEELLARIERYLKKWALSTRRFSENGTG